MSKTYLYRQSNTASRNRSIELRACPEPTWSQLGHHNGDLFGMLIDHPDTGWNSLPSCLLGLSHTVRLFLKEELQLDLNSDLPTMLLLLPSRVHTPLHCAVYSGSLETVKILLTRGAEVEGGVEKDSSTQLYLASWLGLVTIVEALIEHGANVNAKRGLHDRPLQAACS